MRAKFIIYKTGGGPSAPPPPPDPSIAEAAAKRESVAVIQAQARRSSRYGQASLQLDRSSARPSTTPPTGVAPGIIAEKTVEVPVTTAITPGIRGDVQTTTKKVELTDAEKSVNTARTLDYEVQKLMARRNARIGVTSSLGNS